jgi:CubicO group peptidase (beta-lactamase class C family)
MPVSTRNLANHSSGVDFSPEAILAMADALDAVCAALNIPQWNSYELDLIAEQIIDLAEGGLLDVNALCDRVLAERQATRWP